MIYISNVYLSFFRGYVIFYNSWICSFSLKIFKNKNLSRNKSLVLRLCPKLEPSPHQFTVYPRFFLRFLLLLYSFLLYFIFCCFFYRFFSWLQSFLFAFLSCEDFFCCSITALVAFFFILLSTILTRVFSFSVPFILIYRTSAFSHYPLSFHLKMFGSLSFSTF